MGSAADVDLNGDCRVSGVCKPDKGEANGGCSF